MSDSDYLKAIDVEIQKVKIYNRLKHKLSTSRVRIDNVNILKANAKKFSKHFSYFTSLYILMIMDGNMFFVGLCVYGDIDSHG